VTRLSVTTRSWPPVQDDWLHETLRVRFDDLIGALAVTFAALRRFNKFRVSIIIIIIIFV